MHDKNVSLERKKYLKKILLNKVLVLIVQISILIIFIAAWEILANANVIDSFITSQPSRIWNTLINLSNNGLLEHIGITCFETIVGFLSGAVLGVIIAIVLWWSKFLSKVFEPFLVVLNSLPKIALRTCYNYMGWSGNAGYNSYGISNFFNCYYNGNTKWIYKYRQRENKDGKNI